MSDREKWIERRAKDVVSEAGDIRGGHILWATNPIHAEKMWKAVAVALGDAIREAAKVAAALDNDPCDPREKRLLRAFGLAAEEKR